MTQNAEKSKFEFNGTVANRPLIYWLKAVQIIISGCGEVFWERLSESVARHLRAAETGQIELIGFDPKARVKEKFDAIGDTAQFFPTELAASPTALQDSPENTQRIFLILTPDHLHVPQVLECARRFPDAIIVVEKPILIDDGHADLLRELVTGNIFQGKLISLEHYVAKRSFRALMHRLQFVDPKLIQIDELRVCLCEHKDNGGREVSAAYLDFSAHCLLMAVQVFRQTRDVTGEIQIRAIEAALYEHSQGGGTAAEGRFLISSEGCTALRLEFATGKKLIDVKTLRVMSGDFEIAGVDFLRDESNAHEFMFDAIMQNDTTEGFVTTPDSIDACEVIAKEFSRANTEAPLTYKGLWPFRRRIESFLPDDPESSV